MLHRFFISELIPLFKNGHYHNEMFVLGALRFLKLQGSENSTALLGIRKSAPRLSQFVKKLTIPF